jgi:hypothetical protein
MSRTDAGRRAPCGGYPRRQASCDGAIPETGRHGRSAAWQKWGVTLKRALVIALAGVLTFGVVYGFAASLNLTTESLGAADTTVAACQAGALTATYTSSYSAAVPGYAVGTVTVTGLASTCYSKGYKITLSGSGNASLGEATGTTPSSGTSFAATFSPAINAVSITGIGVVISG